MLTGDLVRASVRAGEVRPRYVDPARPELRQDAERLLAIFQEHLGRPVGALDEAIADHIGDSTSYAIQRGLVKLLMDRATVEMRTPADPVAVRAAVFAQAAQRWPVQAGPGTTPRSAVLQAAAETLGLTPAEVDEALYADLKRAQRLVDAELPQVEELLHRYNLGLAQAVLLRAHEARVTLEGLRARRARQLFRWVKFRQLMHRATRQGTTWTLTLDGPLSLLRQTRRYGLGMALFLPALVRTETPWRLEADVDWDGVRARFACDQHTGLVAPAHERGGWESAEEKHLRASWRAAGTPWRLERAARILDLGGRGVLVPDFALTHPDGRVALLEIVWFWRAETFRRRAALLAEEGPPNLIVAVATRLNADRPGRGARGAKARRPSVTALLDAEAFPGALYPFKGVLSPQRLVELAETVAVRPA